jgi:hypothetical protein
MPTMSRDLGEYFPVVVPCWSGPYQTVLMCDMNTVRSEIPLAEIDAACHLRGGERMERIHVTFTFKSFSRRSYPERSAIYC